MGVDQCLITEIKGDVSAICLDTKKRRREHGDDWMSVPLSILIEIDFKSPRRQKRAEPHRLIIPYLSIAAYVLNKVV